MPNETSAAPPHPLTESFYAAMGRVATAVTVVSTDGAGGRFAQTVSAMCSVSAQPPLVLVCLHGRSPVNDAIQVNRVYCVNVLAIQHDHVADTFAGRPWPGKEPWDFTCGQWSAAPSGSPRLQDALAVFDCRVYEVVLAGTHKVYVGEVSAIDSVEGTPLLYSRQFYQRPELQEPSVFKEYPDARPVHHIKETKQ